MCATHSSLKGIFSNDQTTKKQRVYGYIPIIENDIRVRCIVMPRLRAFGYDIMDLAVRDIACGVADPKRSA
jgi:hypothetical protein